MFENNLKKTIKKCVIAVTLLIASKLLMIIFDSNRGLFFPGYRNISKKILSAIAAAASFARNAVWDYGLVVIVVVCIVALIWCIAKKRSVFAWASSVSLLVCAMFFFMTAVWGLNHYAPELSEELSLNVTSSYSKEELEAATRYYLEKAVELSGEVPRDENGSLVPQNFYELAEIAGGSYRSLAEENLLFKGCTLPVKKLNLFGEPLLYSGFNGMFITFSAESSVPGGCAEADKPFVMSHEAAHRLGIAGEDEANFAAFLACAENEDVRFRYSGYFKAFIYCYNSLFAEDYKLAFSLWSLTEDDDVQGYSYVVRDMNDMNAVYKKYEGKAEEVGQKVNNYYLEAFSEQGGVKSYGYVTDYLIALYLN